MCYTGRCRHENRNGECPYSRHFPDDCLFIDDEEDEELTKEDAIAKAKIIRYKYQ